MMLLLLAGALALNAPVPSPAGVENDVLHARLIYGFVGIDGGMAAGGITADAKGVLYGAATYGGRSDCFAGCGFIFSLTPLKNGNYLEKTLHYFNGVDGEAPIAAPIVDATGAVYGTTSYGGNGTKCGGLSCGTAYKLVPSGASYQQTVMHYFQGGSDGGHPETTLLEDAGGSLYGTTSYGGNGASSPDSGTAFKLTPAGARYTEKILYAFGASATAPIFPLSPLIVDRRGNLYGTTYGTSGCGGPMCHAIGVVYELSPSGHGYSESNLYSFVDSRNGEQPVSLVADSHGDLVGSAYQGGEEYGQNYHRGVLFELIPGANGYSYRAIHRFTKTDGNNPHSPMVPDSTGALYGTCSSGGDTKYENGTVFKLTPSGNRGYAYETAYAPSSGMGSMLQGNLVINPAGDIFVSGVSGGPSGVGSIFELTP